MNKYEVIGQIGNGSYGKVSKIIRKSDRKELIWKEMRLEGIPENGIQLIENEINILRELNHPNIVRQYETFTDESNSKLYIVMEYCENGDLDKLILQNKNNNKIIDEQLIWDILIQTLNALKYIHNDKNIIHRDIKPSNIFLDKNYNIKLGDFGLSRKYFNEYANTILGTPLYMAPELLEKKKYNVEADIWALGCSIYEITNFIIPFEAPNMEILLNKIKAGAPKRINNVYSEYLWNIVSQMLTYDYRKRPSSSQLLEECNKIVSIRNNIYNIKNRSEVQSKWEQLIVYDLELQMKEKQQKKKDIIMNEKDKELNEREQKVLEKERLVKEAYKEMFKRNKEISLNSQMLNIFNNNNDIKNKEKNDIHNNVNKNGNYNDNKNNLNEQMNPNNNFINKEFINNNKMKVNKDDSILNEAPANINNLKNNFNFDNKQNEMNLNNNLNGNELKLNNNNQNIFNDKSISNENINGINFNDDNEKNKDLKETMKVYLQNIQKKKEQSPNELINGNKNDNIKEIKNDIPNNNSQIINNNNINNDQIINNNNKFYNNQMINNNLNNNQIINNNFYNNQMINKNTNINRNNNLNNNQIINYNNFNNKFYNNQMINNNSNRNNNKNNIINYNNNINNYINNNINNNNKFYNNQMINNNNYRNNNINNNQIINNNNIFYNNQMINNNTNTNNNFNNNQIINYNNGIYRSFNNQPINNNNLNNNQILNNNKINNNFFNNINSQMSNYNNNIYNLNYNLMQNNNINLNNNQAINNNINNNLINNQNELNNEVLNNNNKNNNEEKKELSQYLYYKTNNQIPKIGLINFRDTSYLNVVIQSLSNIEDLVLYFLDSDKKIYFDNVKNELPLSYEMKEIFCHLYPPKKESVENSYAPLSLLEYISKDKKYSYNKRSNPIYLIKDLLNILDSELNTLCNKNIEHNANKSDKEDIIYSEMEYLIKTNDSLIFRIFSFTRLDESTCEECTNNIYDLKNLKFFKLNISGCYSSNKNKITIKDCLKYQSEVSQKCKLLICQNCHRKNKFFVYSKIFSSPNIFLFLIDRGIVFNSKQNKLLKIPLIIEDQLDLQSFIEKKDSPSKYELIGIVSILIKDNKYVSMCKSPIDNNWYNYNDEEVEIIEHKKVIELSNNYNMYIPCILIYKATNQNN